MAETADAIDRAIDSWLNTHVRSSPIAAATPAWNHLTSILPHLRQSLIAELERTPQAEGQAPEATSPA